MRPDRRRTRSALGLIDTGTSRRDSSSASTACSVVPDRTPAVRDPAESSAVYSNTGMQGPAYSASGKIKNPPGISREGWYNADPMIVQESCFFGGASFLGSEA